MDDVIIVSTVDNLSLKLNEQEKALRDEIASKAMQALISTIKISNDEDYAYDYVAADAYNFANAMMRKRDEYNR